MKHAAVKILLVHAHPEARSLNGSLTVVGDLAQATGPWAPSSWDAITAHLPDRRPSRIVGLSVGYRIPAQIMQLADRVMRDVTPDLRPPRAVREGDGPPQVLTVDTPDRIGEAVAAAANAMIADGRGLSVAVLTPDAMVEEISNALTDAGVAHSRATTSGLDDQVTVVPISVAKGLEIDAVIVVEPARIVSSEIQGKRALYVALTRPTQRLTIVHSEPLPSALAAGVRAMGIESGAPATAASTV